MSPPFSSGCSDSPALTTQPLRTLLGRSRNASYRECRGRMGMIKRTIVAGCLACVPMQLNAESEAAKRFGAREEVQQISLSPDGKRFVALLSDAKRGARAMVFSIDSSTPPVTVVASSGDKEQL